MVARERKCGFNKIQTRCRLSVEFAIGRPIVAPTAALQSFQTLNVKNLHGAIGGSPDEPLLLQSCKRSCCRFRRCAEIIGEIEPVDRQSQARLCRIEKFATGHEFQHEGCKPLADILLAENHDALIGQTAVASKLRQQAELKVRLRRDDLQQALPREAIEPCCAHGFRRIHILATIRKTEEIACQLECENLSMTVFGIATDANDSFLDEINELATLAGGEDRMSALIFNDRGDALELLLIVARKQILRVGGQSQLPVEATTANFR